MQTLDNATCSVAGCDHKVKARMLCDKHITRLYRYGDVEAAKHRRVGMKKHALYNTWYSMVSRCHNEKDRAYKYYGARGITVCERWRLVENFIADMSPRPFGGTLERIDNDKGYDRDNCKWSTRAEQMRNTRRSKFSAEDVIKIRAMATDGMMQKDIAEMYACNAAYISMIVNRRIWQSV